MCYVYSRDHSQSLPCVQSREYFALCHVSHTEQTSSTVLKDPGVAGVCVAVSIRSLLLLLVWEAQDSP